MSSFNDKFTTEVVKKWETKYTPINYGWQLGSTLLLNSVGVLRPSVAHDCNILTCFSSAFFLSLVQFNALSSLHFAFHITYPWDNRGDWLLYFRFGPNSYMIQIHTRTQTHTQSYTHA